MIFFLGIAIFSMFFGAGNIIFPLALGLNAGEHFTLSFLGLILTSIGVPLLGLYGALLYEGNCKQFFFRLGRWPGTLMILLLVLALGPFGAMSRCLTLTYACFQQLFPNLGLPLFTAISAIFILICIFNRTLLLPLLGKFLSPLLLILLLGLIVYGINDMALTASFSPAGLNAFYGGLHKGYQTMDLLAALLFSVTIWRLIKGDKQKIYQNCLFASFIAGFFLMIIYIGLGLTAHANADSLQLVRDDHLLSTLSFQLLGPKLGIISNLIIALACFTTIISLAVAGVEVLWQTCKEMPLLKLKEKSFYTGGIISITVLTALFANLGFEAISNLINPIVTLCYPALITLTLCNILHKKLGFSLIKLPVFGVLFVTLLAELS